MRAAARQDPHRAARERVTGFGRPDAGGVDDRRGRDLEVAVRSRRSIAERVAIPLTRIGRGPVARTRVTATASGAMAVRATASV